MKKKKVSIDENEEAYAMENGDMINDGIYSILVDKHIIEDLSILQSFYYCVNEDAYFLGNIHKSICNMNRYLPEIIGEPLYEFIKDKIDLELKKHYNDIYKAEKEILRIEKIIGIHSDYGKTFISRCD